MPGMVERLLRTIYAPQNLYCLHVDLKASKKFRQAMEHLADCFPNVFLARRPVQVTYASYSRLEADFMCMEVSFVVGFVCPRTIVPYIEINTFLQTVM